MRNLFIVLLVLLIVGCSHASTPVNPGNEPTTQQQIQNSISSGEKVLWGLYDVTLDPVMKTAEIVPLRSAEFKANVTQFVQPPIGKPFYVGFKNLDFSDFTTEGIIRLTVSLTHPFQGLDQYRGFDVMGVFMGDGSWSLTSDPDAVFPRPDGSESRLLNADGYTRWFNPTEFPAKMIFGFVPGAFGSSGFTPNATVNGYKYFADYLGAGDNLEEFFNDPSNIENRGSFTPGSINSRDYEIQFDNPGGPIKYQYGIFASWSQPSNPSSPTLDDFSLEANSAEAFLVVPDTSDSTVYYKDETDFGGTLIGSIRIFDWQAMDGGGGGVPVPDQIDHIWIDSFFDVFMSPVDILPDATILADGPVSSVFQFEITSVNPIGAGDMPLLFTVESKDPNSYDQGFGSPSSDGILSAYVTGSVTVQSESPYNQAPSVGNITGETAPLEIDVEDYEISALDPEDDPLHYEWSLVPSGSAEVWGNVGSDQAIISISWSDYGPGDYDLHCRVKDDYNPWQTASNDPLQITVSELTITCGNGVFGYLGYAWTDHDGVEPAFLSDGSVIIQYTIASLNWNWFNSMNIMYKMDIGGYCYYTPVSEPCEDDWCRDWSHLYDLSDGTDTIIHMDSDFSGTMGPNSETDDVVAFVLINEANIVRFIGNINNTSQTPASDIANKAIPTGTVIAIDFDEAGDLWVLDSTGNVYELTKSSTYSVGSPEFNLNMSTIAPDTVKVFDWAISYLNDNFFIFTDETVGGTIHRISPSGTIVDSVYNALDAGNSNPAYGLGSTGARGDIEIDH
ncbi:MAG: hypothetical protein ABIC40_06855, partial [bacterium]